VKSKLDTPLTAFDIAALRLEHAELAFLSASSTNVPDRTLADEAVHLSSAFQLAGFRQTIGTLWSAADRPSVQLALDFYSTLFSSDGKSLEAARALHEAVRRQRGILA